MNTVDRIIQIISSILTVIAVGMSIFLGFYILNQKSDISSEYMVYTGVRTTDRGQPYLLPVSSPENDAYARAYGCMMDAGIGREPWRCETQDSIEDFQTCIRARPLASQCDQFISSPHLDFFHCVQRNYNVTVRQTNVFRECLTLSQPPTFQSTQNAGSTVFLGSYNYAVLLVDALTILASFLVFTSGGWFFNGSVSRYAPKNNHITGPWSPFSIYRIFVAWFWNVVAFLFAVAIAYSNADVNAANREDREKRFPTTLWTCMLSIGSLAVAVAFFTYYAFEWVFTGDFMFWQGNSGGSETGPGGDLVGPPADSGQPIDVGARSAFHMSGRRRYAPKTYASALSRRFAPLTRWHRGLGGGYIGVRLYDDDVSSDDDIKAEQIMPLMLQAFAWAWVLTDGLFFVGMLTSQSSITNESVARVFVSITAGRFFQLAGAYMAYKAYIKKIDIPGDVEKHGVLIASTLVHVASLFCIGIASAEFMSTLGFSRVASLPTASFPSYNAIQWCFIIFVVVLPETLKLLRWLSIVLPNEESKYTPGTLLVFAEVIFTWEWLARLILAIITIIPLSVAVKDQKYILINYMIGAA